MAKVDIAETWLTTNDNPYNPFDEWDAWYNYDEQNGYHTSEYIARVAKVSQSMSDSEWNWAVDQAIKEILAFDYIDLYKLVKNTTKSA